MKVKEIRLLTNGNNSGYKFKNNYEKVKKCFEWIKRRLNDS